MGLVLMQERKIGSKSDQELMLEHLFQGNKNAVDMILILGEISQVWDDLIDGDDCSAEDINKAFSYALVHLPRNPFYEQYFLEIQPLIEQSIMNWVHATEIEKTKNADLYHLSFVLRDSLTDLILRCAMLIGGGQWANDNAIQVRSLFYDESFEDYVKKLSGA